MKCTGLLSKQTPSRRGRLEICQWLLVSCLAVVPVLAAGEPTTAALVESGEAAPDDNGGTDGSYDFFVNRMVTGRFGEVVFPARLTDARRGIFKSDGVITQRVVIRGQNAPDRDGLANGTFTSFYENISINAIGQIAFESTVQSPSEFYAGIWVWDGLGLTLILRSGETLENFGVIDSLGAHSQINALGQIALRPAASGDTRILLATGADIVTIASSGGPAPGTGNPKFREIGAFDDPLLNDQGHVAFSAAVNRVSPSQDLSGLYIFDGTEVVQIAREGDFHEGIGEFGSFFRDHDLNERGEVAFEGSVVGGGTGVFRGSKDEIVPIARVGDPAPDTTGFDDGTILRIDPSQTLINNKGEVVFRATISGAPSGSTAGLFIGDGTYLRAVVREGDPSPDGDGSIVELGVTLPARDPDTLFSFNEWGQVAFYARVSDSGATSHFPAIFLWDKAAGPMVVARRPDPLGTGVDGTIHTFLGTSPTYEVYQDAFNDHGQVAFIHQPEPSGPQSMALWDPGDIFPPEVSEVRIDPPSPNPGDVVRVLANVTDVARGADIQSAEYQVDGGAWQSMDAADGAFDSPNENVEADISVVLTGEHVICVRGTDALGWTSDPECVSVALDAVGLLVRCLHSPLYPQDGDFLSVTAQALDRDGVPVVADEIEIYINDRDTPVFTDHATDREIAANVAVTGTNMFYGCRARRSSEDAFSRYVTVDVGDPNNPEFPAIPVLYHGPMAEKIDLVFFPDFVAYPDGHLSQAFQDDLYMVIREGLFEIPWFVKYQWVINVWIATEGAGVEPRVSGDPTSRCKRDKPDGYGRKYSFGDAVGIIHQAACRDVAIPGSPFTTAYNEGRLQVVAHEIGHKAFSLADEYTGTVTVRYSAPPFPNLFPTLANCRFAAEERGKDPDECRELSGGLLNLNGQFIFEPNYRNDDDRTSETGDLMQQTGRGPCSFDSSRNCDRYRIGDSEEARVHWKLSKCIGGKC